MSKRQILLRDLVATLQKLGFEQRRRGSHGIFFHPPSGLILTLPMNNKEVPSLYVKAALRQVVARGILSEDEFDALIK